MTVYSDNFQRADSNNLGANWTADPGSTEGSLHIVSDQLDVGAITSQNYGNYWSADPVGSAQFSTITVGVVPSVSDWVGATVYAGSGSTGYLAIIFNNGGNWQWMLFKVAGTGNWQAPSSLTTGGLSTPPSVGDTFTLQTDGTGNLSCYLNGVQLGTAHDTSYTSGAPGIGIFSNSQGTAKISAWSGGDLIGSDLSVSLSGTSGDVSTYSVVSPINTTGGAGAQDMRVLTPSSPNPALPHGFLWLLPVEPGQGTQYGDGIGTVEALDISNEYNLTCIQPGFPVDPWYGDNVSDSSTKQETFIMDLVAWAEANLATTGTEKHYLIGFSKSGFGGQVLFLRHQDVFQAVASWDMAADYQTLAQYDGADVFGTQANLDSYKLYDPNLQTLKAEGNTGTVNRIWLGAGINLIQATSDYDARLTADGITHTYSFVAADSHNWAPTPGWVGPAIAAMLGSPSPSSPKPMPQMALFP